MKKSAVIALLTAIVLCFGSCGTGMREQLMGTWTLTKVNGTGIEQYAAAMGRDICDVAVNYTFYEDIAVKKTADEENEAAVEWQKDGAAVSLADVFVYDEEKDALVIAYDDGNIYIYTRGEFDFN